MNVLNVIVDVVDVGYPFQGGAQITHLTFLRQLAARGHRCTYLDSSLVRRPVSKGPVRLDFYRDFEELKAKVGRRRPDLLFGGLHGIHQIIRLGKHRGIPTIAYLNSYEYAPPTSEETRRWKLSFGRPYPTPAEREFALRNADVILANSEHLRRRMLEREGVETEVVYPEFHQPDFIIPDRDRPEGEYVAGICGYAYKGADIFLELARRFPDQAFLLVGALHREYHPRFKALPNVTLLPFGPPKQFLRRARVMLVPSQWAEPFGRIAVEAMANGIPTLVSRTGGLKEIVGGSRLGINAFRSPDAWEAKLAPLLGSAEARRRCGEQARELARPFLGGESANRLAQLVDQLVAGAGPRRPARMVVAFRGRSDATSAYARINAEWSRRLGRRGGYEVVSLPDSAAFSPTPVDVCILHSYEQDFEQSSVPDEGKLVAVRTWDFGRFPAAWVRKVNQECDQLWVYSRWVRRQAIAGGVEPRRVRVVPPGIDEQLFKPAGPIYPLPTGKSFRFLFVGATVFRKGIDLLLTAYGQAFTRRDDVCLVVKDRPGDSFYAGISYQDEILARARDPAFPEIVYLCEDLAAEELAALYRACDVGVFPYRAEGFALPILEGMACGLPPIVPRFGASLDYCSPANAFRVAARRINLPVRGQLAFNTLGFTAELDEVDFCELPVDRLAATMRKVYRMPPERLRRKAEQAVQVAHGRFRWSDSLGRLERALAAVAGRAVPTRLARGRAATEHERRVFQTARAMFLDLTAERRL